MKRKEEEWVHWTREQITKGMYGIYATVCAFFALTVANSWLMNRLWGSSELPVWSFLPIVNVFTVLLTIAMAGRWMLRDWLDEVLVRGAALWLLECKRGRE